MYSITHQNMGQPESIARFVLGMLLIIAVHQPSVSPLLALVGLYPVFTAMLKWDPTYALYALMKPAKSQSKTSATPSRRATA